MGFRRCLLLVTVLAAFAAPAVARPATPPPDQTGPYKVGRLTFTVVDPSRDNRVLQTDVWFPVDPSTPNGPASVYQVGVDLPPLSGVVMPSSLAMSGVTASTAGPFPMVVFSHGQWAWRYVLSYLCEHLASHGFVVAAPDHIGDRAIDYYNGTTDPLPQVDQDRPLDISFIITQMLARNSTPGDALQGRINSNQIGVFGWSLGGFATMATAVQFGVSPPDTRVKALLGICPTLESLTTEQLATITTPTFFLSGTADTEKFDARTMFQLVASPVSYYAIVQRAWHLGYNTQCDIYQYMVAHGYPSWQISDYFYYPNDTCPPDLLPSAEVHRMADLYAAAFFRRRLAGDTRYDPYLQRSYAQTTLGGEVDFYDGSFPDRNGNGLSDADDIAAGRSADANHNGIPDECEATRLYVNKNATGNNWGTSWADAYTSLSTALHVAAFNPDHTTTEIWVAAGTYHPVEVASGQAADRTVSFQMVPGLSVYGGFAGNESALSERDWVAHPTTLSGDLWENDGPVGTFLNTSENSNIVVSGAGLYSDGVLDGFIIRGGNANGNVIYYGGGGISGLPGYLPDIRHCIITQNQAMIGGGIAVTNGNGPRISSCLVTFNRAFSGGRGGAGGGGGLAAEIFGYPTLVNCTFSGNEASQVGGGIYAYVGSSIHLSNSIAWGDTSWAGSELGLETYSGGSPASHISVDYCDIEGGSSGAWLSAGNLLSWGTGNLNADPLFVDATPGGSLFMPKAASLCIDTGSPSYLRADDPLDLSGGDRSTDGNQDSFIAPDMGAYELHPRDCPADVAPAHGDGVINTFDLGALFPHFGQLVPPYQLGDTNGDGRVDTIDLGLVLTSFGGACP